MPYAVTRNGGPTAIFGVKTVFDMLHPSINTYDLIERVKRREEVDVRFKDGTPGTVSSTDGQRPLALTYEPPGQAALALPGSELRDYSVEGKFLVEVPLLVQCKARNSSHAQTVVKETFQGIRPVDAGFAVEVNHDDMLAEFDVLQRCLGSADLAGLTPSHVLIEQVYLTRPEPSHAQHVDLSVTRTG